MLNPRFVGYGEQKRKGKSKETPSLKSQGWLRVVLRNKARGQATDGISSEAVSDLNPFPGVMESNSAGGAEMQTKRPLGEKYSLYILPS